MFNFSAIVIAPIGEILFMFCEGTFMRRSFVIMETDTLLIAKPDIPRVRVATKFL